MCERGPLTSPRHDLSSVGAQRGARARRERARRARARRELAAAPVRAEVRRVKSPEPQALEEFKPRATS